MKFKESIWKYIALTILVLIIVPFIINESYKTGKGYVTMWKAEDILQYFGSCISALGTIVLGIVSYMQNEKIHKLNEKLAFIEQRNNLGYFLPKTTLKPTFSDGTVGRIIDYAHDLSKGIDFFNGSKDDIFLLSSKCYYNDKICEENNNINMFFTNSVGDFNNFLYEPNIPKKDLQEKSEFQLEIHFKLENIKKYQYFQIIKITLQKKNDNYYIRAVNFEIKEDLEK